MTSPEKKCIFEKRIRAFLGVEECANVDLTKRTDTMYFGGVICLVLIPLVLSFNSTTKTWTKPRHILELSAEERSKFINSIDAVYSDIDGVVWNLLGPIDGAPDGFKALSKAGKKYNFVTNNSVRTEDQCDKRLRALGLDSSELIHPSKSIVKYLVSINFDGLIYCIGSENFKAVLRKGGFKVLDGPTKIFEEDVAAIGRTVFDREPVRAVVVDVDFNLSGVKMIRAQVYLKHPDCILISGATDMMLPLGNDLQILGPGPYVKVLAEASGKKPIVLAKPGAELAELILDHLSPEEKKRRLMIGDMLEQDIEFGKTAGMQTLIVLSGGCSKEELFKNTSPQKQPDYYADSMFDFVKLFESSKL